MTSKKSINKRSISEAVVRDIVEAVSTLDYGSVVIKVHNSKITQIEVTKRKRFDETLEVEKGGGI